MSIQASDRTKKADNRTTMELGAVLPRTAEVRDGHLFVGGVDMVELAQREGTALYVYDEADIRSRMREYRDAFCSEAVGAAVAEDAADRAPVPAPVPEASAAPEASAPLPNEVIYAGKAFLNKEMVRIVAEEGLCLDVSGGGELACALSVGFPAQRIFVHGNNKTERELREAISAGVGRIVIDSRIELKRISRIAGELGVTQKIYMRITPGVEADTHEYIRTGCEDSKFGFTVNDDFAFRCVADVKAAPNVELAGIHCHIGSMICSLDAFQEAADVMVGLMARIRETYGLELRELDLGGGLGISYTAGGPVTPVADYAAFLRQAVREACAAHRFPVPALRVEPGRSIVGCAGITLYTVGILKTLPDIRKYVAIDGGISDNIRTALYHAEYEPVVANKADEPRTEIVTLCGKHCESGDVVAVDRPMQRADVGDIVCVFATGAYCYTMSSTYNGQPRPAIVFVKDGRARTVTRRETYADLMARDV